MKKFSLIAIIGLISFSSYAQTKLIAHKSRGGSDATFTKALQNDRQLENSNYGQAPAEFVFNANLDSVIFINDSMTVMVTSFADNAYRGSNIVELNFCSTFIGEEGIQTWSPGRDTVLWHEVFSNPISIHEMQELLDERYFFENKAEHIKFINFPERGSIPEREKRNELPFLTFHVTDIGKGLLHSLVAIGFIALMLAQRRKFVLKHAK